MSELSAADLMRLKSKLLGDVRKELQSQRVLVAERRHEKLSGALQIERQYVELDK